MHEKPTLVYGEPKFLCRDAVALVFEGVDENLKASSPDDVQQLLPGRFVLLSSAGVSTPDDTEADVRSWGETKFVQVLAAALPPFRDNIAAVDYLYEHSRGGGGGGMEWVAVRPDDFIDTEDGPAASGYELFEKLQNGLFNAGVSSVANIGECMADLAVGDEAWEMWKGKMPQLLDDIQPMRTLMDD